MGYLPQEIKSIKLAEDSNDLDRKKNFKKIIKSLKGGVKMNKININGQTIMCSGNNISINNGVIKVDGKVIKQCEIGNLNVTIEGDIENIACDGSVTVNGNVSKSIDCNGSVKVSGDVVGNIDCSGSCSCGNVSGNIDAGGSVSCRK